MAETATVPATTPGGVDPATGTPAVPDVKYVTAEDFDGHRKFLNSEFQARRKETENLASQLKEQRELLESLKPATAATGEGKGAKDLPTAETERRIKTL
jgi:hypothetical protein